MNQQDPHRSGEGLLLCAVLKLQEHGTAPGCSTTRHSTLGASGDGESAR